MPRARRSSGSRSRASARSAQANEVSCPECGKTFGRAAALGAHRRHAHGVVGASTQRRAKPSSTTSPRRSAPSPRSSGDHREISRDALLQAVFPGGVPPREAVIRAANSWLDEADRLASMK
jgi:hypothetical protein